MKRRDFLKSTAAIAAAAGTGNVLRAAEQVAEENPEESGGPLIVSAPMLQNYAETSVGVVFAVSALANGYAIYGEKEDLSDGKKVKCGGRYVTNDIDDRVMRIRLIGLKPDTEYFYRIGADRIQYKTGSKMKILGTEEDPRTYRFRTAGPGSPAHFCVINDTHAKWEAFGAIVEKIAVLAPSCVIWNGDATNSEMTVDSQVKIFLNPEIERKDYASERAYLFCPGNHDFRGMANRHLERVWIFRQPEERLSRDWDLGRNFAVRMGDVALIGLDTAEDKLDTNPRFAGLFNSAEYREAQVAWLEDALQRPEIRKAPHLVAFCHIPLFDPRPTANPGDIAPADTDPRYKATFAAWQRTCAKLWTPLLEKAGCKLIITGHQHRYRRDDPTEDRPWTQLVGGSPKFGDSGPEEFPTVIEGEVRGKNLVITVHNLMTGEVQDTVTFTPRKRR